MLGMDKHTGLAIEGLEHLRQSIEDILTTPKGSRVMNREYGSDLFTLVDNPYSQVLVGDITMAVSQALLRWEPRFELQSVAVDTLSAGVISLDISGIYLQQGKPVTLEGIVI